MNEAAQYEIGTEDEIRGNLSLHSHVEMSRVGRYEILRQYSGALLEDFDVSDREVGVVRTAELLGQSSHEHSAKSRGGSSR